jgi:ABC-2 type transport system ATP-binding protein
MLQAIHLTKEYGDGVRALDNLDLEVNDGEIFCLLGANGAGKTTTINIFLSFIEPSSGEALVDGLNVAEDPFETRSRTSYVSENVALYRSLTAVQNLEFLARLSGREDCGRDQLTGILDRVGLQSEAFDQRVGRFSKGMRQKLGIAVALVKRANNVLLDEPTSGLDPKAAADLMELLESLREEQCAVLISTHDIFRARDVADRIGIMKQGRLVAVRTRDELAGEDLQRIYLDYMEAASESC